MPSPDSLKIKLFSPIPSAPEFDLDGKMLTKDATTKDCLFTMTEYLSENVLQSIPKEFRIKQFFDKGLFKSFRKQNPYNIPVKKDKNKKPEPAKKGELTEKPEPTKEDNNKKPAPVKEGKPTENPEQVENKKEKSPPQIPNQGGGKDTTTSTDDPIVSNRELISTYRKIINHNIRLTLNTLFQKNNKIIVKGNTYTIGYYNWTDYDWDIDAKRPTFDKQKYVTSQSVTKSLEKIPPILKHGLTTSNDKLNAENDLFSVAVFDNQEDAIKENEAYIKAKENEAAIKAKENEAAIKAKEKLQQKPEVMDLSKDDSEEETKKTRKLHKVNGRKISRGEIDEMGKEISPSEILPDITSRPGVSTRLSLTTERRAAEERASQELSSMNSIEPLQKTVPVEQEIDEAVTVNEVPNTQSGGETNENNSNTQGDSFSDSRRYSDSSHRSSSFDSRRRYDPRYDPRYRSQSKMVNVDESNFAIFISVELYLVKGDTLTPEDESNLNCKNKWNQVLVPFDKLIGREKRGVLPDYSLEPTSKPEESPKPSGSIPTAKESIPTAKEPAAHGGTRHRSKTLRRKKRKTTKKNKHKKRRAFRTTRKHKLRGSSVRK